MSLKELKDLVKKGEGLQLEFKLKAAHPEKIVREIVAFANTEGGILLIGVNDDKILKGLKFADEDDYILVKAIEKYCYPLISYSIERIPITDELEILKFEIHKSDQRPHYVKSYIPNQDSKSYIRVRDKTVQASKEVREILKGKRKEKDLRFQYGEKEKQLIEYLSTNKYITLLQFMSLAKVSRQIASRTLVLLSLSNVLKIEADEIEDRFLLS